MRVGHGKGDDEGLLVARAGLGDGDAVEQGLPRGHNRRLLSGHDNGDETDEVAGVQAVGGEPPGWQGDPDEGVAGGGNGSRLEVGRAQRRAGGDLDGGGTAHRGPGIGQRGAGREVEAAAAKVGSGEGHPGGQGVGGDDDVGPVVGLPPAGEQHRGEGAGSGKRQTEAE